MEPNEDNAANPPPAQDGTQPDAVNDGSNGKPQIDPAIAAGIQKRFDEMTAQSYAKLEAKDKQIEQLMQAQAATLQQLAQLAAAQGGQQTPKEVAPQIDWSDPASVQAGFDYRLKQTEERLVNAFGGQLQGLRSQLASNEVLNEAQMMGIKNNAVVARAKELMAGWSAKGIPFLPKDALIYAKGELGDGSGKPIDARGSQTPANIPHTPPAPPTTNGAKKALPANFDSLPLDKQEKILEARLGDDAF